MSTTENNTTVPFRPLGHLMNVVDKLKLEVTYAYDDLVFIEHNAFLFRMGSKGEDVHLYFNEESIASERYAISEKVIAAGKENCLNIKNSGFFTLKPKENNQIEVKFTEI